MNINIPSAILLALTVVGAAYLTNPVIIFLFFLFFVIPGFVLTELLPFRQLPLEVKLILNVSLGIALVPLVTWLFAIFSIPLTQTTVITFLVIFAIASIRIFRFSGFRIEKRLQGLEILLIGILFLSIFSRLFPIHNLQVPPFADPALQGMITRLILIHQGIPDNWSPFLPIAFQHQPGFASIVTWFSLFSSVPIPRIILFLTNIFHALFPFSLYLLAYSLSKNRFGSALCAAMGLIAIFPTSLFVAGANATVLMYPLSIVAVGSVILFLREGTTHLQKAERQLSLPRKYSGFSIYRNALLFFAVLFSGSMLIHPTFVVFFSLILGPYVVFLFLRRKKEFLHRYALQLSCIALALLVAGTAVAPFFLHSMSNENLLKEQWGIQAGYMNPQHKLSPYFFLEPVFFLFDNPQGSWYLYLENFSLPELLSHPVGLLMTTLFLYSLFFLWRKKDKLGYFLLALYLIFLALSWVQSVARIEFPWWTIVYPTRIKFLIVLPVALLISLPFFRRPVPWFSIRQTFLFLPLVIIILVTPYNLLSITRNLRALSSLSPFSQADARAMQWIAQNIPKDALIFNAIRDVEAGVFIGGSGQWIPTLTSRKILLPALSLTEDVLDPRVANRLLVMRGIDAKLAGEKNFLEILRSYNIQYIFLSPSQMQTRRTLFENIDPEQFLSSPYYKLEFQDRDTYIFSVLYPETP